MNSVGSAAKSSNLQQESLCPWSVQYRSYSMVSAQIPRVSDLYAPEATDAESGSNWWNHQWIRRYLSVWHLQGPCVSWATADSTIIGWCLLHVEMHVSLPRDHFIEFFASLSWKNLLLTGHAITRSVCWRLGG